MFCLNCGAKLDDSAAYCTTCGQAVSQEPTPIPTPASTPQEPPPAHGRPPMPSPPVPGVQVQVQPPPVPGPQLAPPPPPVPGRPQVPPPPYLPPPPLPYGQPPMAGYVPIAARNEGLFIAGMILGICSLLFYPLGLVLGGLAIIFFVVGMKHLAAQPMLRGKGMGIAGLVTGIIGALGSIIFWLAVVLDPNMFNV